MNNNKDCQVGQQSSPGLEGVCVFNWQTTSRSQSCVKASHTSDLFIQLFSLPVSKVILQEYDYGARNESEVSVSVVADLF